MTEKLRFITASKIEVTRAATIDNFDKPSAFSCPFESLGETSPVEHKGTGTP
jgi:hypothetical protein